MSPSSSSDSNTATTRAGEDGYSVLLKDLLENAFDEDGRLSGSTFPTIGTLRAIVRTKKRAILESLNELVMSPPSNPSCCFFLSGGSLCSDTNGQIVIPVAEDKYRKDGGVGIVHDVSRSGKTVYVEPTNIVGPTNEMRLAESELKREESRVWRLLTEETVKRRR